MEQYINKSALVAEIDRQKIGYNVDGKHSAEYDITRKIIDIIDTLDVKEVDDEKCKEYDKALSIAKAWYQASDSSSQERNVARMIMGDKVREEL